DDPLAPVVQAGLAALRLRVLVEAAAVIVDSANIGLVVQDPGAAVAMDADRRVAPFGALGAGYGRHAVVEVDGEFPRRASEDILLVDPADDLGFLLVDLAQARHAVALRIVFEFDAVAVGKA